MEARQLMPNRLREKLEQGNRVIGTCAYSFSPDIVQLAGYCGMDFCRVDNEHAWRRDSALENMIRAGHVAGTAVMARVDRDNPYLIRKVLELGADAILVPQIENQGQVEKVLQAAKFPPLGSRGFGNLNQSGRYGIVDPAEWIRWSNSQPMIGVMVETKTAVKDIDSIVSVPGLDFVTIGAADLSISLGLDKPDPRHEDVVNCIHSIVKSANEHQVSVMIGVGAPWVDHAQKCFEIGIDMVEIGHDYTVLQSIWSDAASRLKRQDTVK